MAITVLQKWSFGNIGVNSTTTVGSFPSNTTAGSLLIACITARNENGTAITMTTPVTLGLTWTLGTAMESSWNYIGNLSDVRCELFYVLGAASISSSTTTSVSATTDPSVTSLPLIVTVYEVQGIDPTSTPQFAIQAGPVIPNTTTVAAGSFTIGTPGFVFCLATNPYTTPGTGFTLGVEGAYPNSGSPTFIYDASEYLVTSGSYPQTVNAQWAIADSEWICIAGLFASTPAGLCGVTTPTGNAGKRQNGPTTVFVNGTAIV